MRRMIYAGSIARSRQSADGSSPLCDPTGDGSPISRRSRSPIHPLRTGLSSRHGSVHHALAKLTTALPAGLQVLQSTVHHSMDSPDQRARREQPADYIDPARPTADVPLPVYDRLDAEPSGYTLMVAGRRTGKTSFLRLLLDTSVLSPSATHDQLQSVAKFIQGCAGYTPHLRSVSVNIDQAVADVDKGRQDLQTLALTLIDTPSLDYEDEPGSQQVVSEILRHLDARFSESIDDVSIPSFSHVRPRPTRVAFQERKAYAGDHHVHL